MDTLSTVIMNGPPKAKHAKAKKLWSWTLIHRDLAIQL